MGGEAMAQGMAVDPLDDARACENTGGRCFLSDPAMK